MRYREGDPYVDILKVRNVKISDMNLREMSITGMHVKTTRCDETCKRYDMDKFCPERRWMHETTKLFRRRLLQQKKKYPVCLVRRKIAKETGCLKHVKKGTGVRRPFVEVPTY